MTAMMCSLNSCEKTEKDDPESGYNEGGNNGGNNGGDNGGSTSSDLVETIDVSNISSTSATLKGRINSHPNEEVAWYGFIYSTSSYMLEEHHLFDNKSGGNTFYEDKEGTFTYTADDLSAETIYYVRAFAHISGENTYYGSIVKFTTQRGDYYIKHPWGRGAWSWNRMSKSGSVYTYTGLYGGVGANINTSPNDEGAMWFPMEDIEGWNQINQEGEVRFTYNPETRNLSVSQ